MFSLKKRARHLPLESQFSRLIWLGNLPLLILVLVLMYYAGLSIWLNLLVGLLGVIGIAYLTFVAHSRMTWQFRSLSNLLDSLSQGDYSIRARYHQTGGAVDDFVAAMNRLAAHLSEERWISVESQLLVQTVIAHIDVAILAISQDNVLRFYNPAAQKLLQLGSTKSSEQLVNQFAFLQNFSSGYQQVLELQLGHQRGRFHVHLEEFRDAGMQHKLLFITDVRTLLRREERKAWQSLVRVLSHEINNSLAPIASISQTLVRLIERQEEAINSKDVIDGLHVISERAKGLNHFIKNYQQLAKLPPPCRSWVLILPLLQKLKKLFKDYAIDIAQKPDVLLFVDPVQIEQVLINLIKNACEAEVQNPSQIGVLLTWEVTPRWFRLHVIDSGPGLSNPDNLFVPFYSTKKQGTGIGLVLSRQILESHQGNLFVANRSDHQGCCATIEIPFGENLKAI